MSTLTNGITSQHAAILLSEDVWLTELYKDLIHDFEDYLNYSKKFRSIIKLHVRQLFQLQLSVVFGFSGNTPQERQWGKSICDDYSVDCELHSIQATDKLCKKQL